MLTRFDDHLRHRDLSVAVRFKANRIGVILLKFALANLNFGHTFAAALLATNIDNVQLWVWHLDQFVFARAAHGLPEPN